MAAISNLGNTNQMLLEPATSSNGAKIPELEIANFVARQDAEKWQRNCSALEEKLARLEEDCGVLREREVKDRERIKSLVEELERKERDFREKFVEVVELRRKCEELEGEISGLRGNAVKMPDEMPKRGKEDRVVTPEQKRSRELVAANSESEGESDDGVLLRQLKKKRVMEVGYEADKGDECKEPCDEGDTEVDEEADSRIPLVPMNGVKEGFGLNSKGLLEVAKSEYKLLTRNRSPRSKRKFKSFIARCSSTARNSVISDYDGVAADLGPRSYCRRNSKIQNRERGYTGRIASSEEKNRAITRAEELQRNLNSDHPSFVKSVMRSHVSTSFWIGFPPKFCEENLPTRDRVRMVLEDEKGVEHNVNYIGYRGGLRGGWKGFGEDHNLEIGDALLFVLTEPKRFKVYIIKANHEPAGDLDDKIAEGDTPVIHKQSENTSSAEADTPAISEQAEGSNRAKTRGKPLRFRFVRRNIPKLEMPSKPEGRV
ncbi:uncharacterized protein A4U43_C01F17840 [Asparagus officinalis]|uniref:TF-B3 domain-containing protein n=1 Tax=Asparagus officinalis TaxID=4686 RepID=A0A5P1FUV9_ASPOF|nr:uncharacterized protein LOC109825043 [Asparagus officinalis]ONK80450.1 uncharacterized protein A4U43_C01F17840 [Asparagus officinalis]